MDLYCKGRESLRRKAGNFFFFVFVFFVTDWRGDNG